MCDRWNWDTWETFKIEDLDDGKVIALKGGGTYKYCSDDKKDGVKCYRKEIRSWEKFKVEYLDNECSFDGGGRQKCKIALKGGRSGKYYADEPNGIRCNRDTVGQWEQFELKDLIVGSNRNF